MSPRPSPAAPGRAFVEEVAALWARTDDESWPRFAVADQCGFLVAAGATRVLRAPPTAPLAPALRAAADLGPLVVGAARFAPRDEHGEQDEGSALAWEPFGGAFFFSPRHVVRGANGPVPPTFPPMFPPMFPPPMVRPQAAEALGSVDLVETEGSRYRRALEAALRRIDEGGLAKVVVARRFDVSLSSEVCGSRGDLRPAVPTLVAALVASAAGTSSRVYLLAPSADVVWLGATPERLAGVQAGVVETEAVAGTCLLDGVAAEDALPAFLSSDKERREHHAVVEHLRACLERLGATLDDSEAPAAPSVRRLRGLAHLVTPLRARLPATVKAVDVIAALHPTPAMNGVPSLEARAFLASHEGLDRGLYAGPIGVLADDGDNASMDVGIRGVLLGPRGASIYAGSGLVRGSTVEDEARETVDKARAIAASLGLGVRDVREAAA